MDLKNLYVITILPSCFSSWETWNRYFKHSHKKRKDNLETRGKLPVLRTYVENQDILQTILLYRSSKCRQTKEQGSEDCL